MTTPAPLVTDALPSRWPTVATAVVLLTAIISVLLVAFAWPSVRSSVHDVPIALAGPGPAVAQIRTALEQRLPGGFEITEVTDTAAAEQLIRDRQVYGAIDLSSDTPQVIITSAASTAVAQTLQIMATGLGQADKPGTPVAVRDLAALPTDDPRGTGLAAGALPLVMGGLLAAVLLTRLVRGTVRRVTGALTFAATGGLTVAAILQFWLGSLSGSYPANTGAIALTIAATSMTVLGLESLLGYAGIGIGAVVMMLIGNPLSGTATAPEMLPGWSGTLGQLLPPGAGGRLLRSTAFFDGRGATHAIVVLLVWVALGALLCLVGGLRARRAANVATGLRTTRTPPAEEKTTSAPLTAPATRG
ncbi:ABC transporter permease [Nocardia vinacea]|uniref:ABC transporter permease n=1 Tax=Nocardia vinacea TaxID=96468 RepID=UPI0002D9EBB6|nr:ABC transporter permease [Nocardia vinacea]